MIVGGYSLHLYCDVGGDPYAKNCPNKPWHGKPTEFDGKSKHDTYTQARRQGWKINVEGRAICPKCAKEGRK